MDSCGEAGRLLDIYITALSAFHDAQEPILRGLLSDDSDSHSVLRRRELAQAAALRARQGYWAHVRSHGCRERKG